MVFYIDCHPTLIFLIKIAVIIVLMLFGLQIQLCDDSILISASIFMLKSVLPCGSIMFHQDM